MRIVVAGGHGQIARAFGSLATPTHEVVGLIRDPGQVNDLEAAGMKPELLDLETSSAQEVAEVMAGSGAVLFAAGAGPGSGPARKETVDYGAAVKCVDAAVSTEVQRFVMISAMGTDDPPGDDSVYSVYLRAKAGADSYLMDSPLEWTVVRPGRLTNDPPAGKVRLARHVPRGEIPRADVAAVVLESLLTASTVRRVFEVVGGDTPIAEAVTSLSRRT